MVIQRPFQSVFERLERARRERRLSAGAVVGVGISALLHVAGAVWIYNQHFRPPAPPIEAPGVKTTILPLPVDIVPPPTPRRIDPPPPVPVHRPAPTPIDPILTSPIPPQPPRPVLDNPRPEVISPATAPDLPPGPPLTAPAAPPSPPTRKSIDEPNWLKRPNADQLAQYYPARALDREVSGSATLSCLVTAAGALSACAVVEETPAHEGFGAAALKLARYFVMSPRTEDGTPVDGGSVRVPIKFAVR